MKLQEIIANDCSYLSDVQVTVNSSYETVTIVDCTGRNDDIFLQGDEGSVFISKVMSIYNNLGDVTWDDVALHLAKTYVDCIWN